MSSYYAVMYGKLSSSGLECMIHALDYDKVAIMDNDTLVCRWFDAGSYAGQIVGVDCTNMYFPKQYIYALERSDLRIKKYKKNIYWVVFRGVFHEIVLKSVDFYCDGVFLLHDDRLSGLGIDFVMVCNSGEGIYRFVFQLLGSSTQMPFSMRYLNLWVDMESGIALCYAWGLGEVWGICCVAGLSKACQEKYDRLVVRITKSSLFRGEGRLF